MIKCVNCGAETRADKYEQHGMVSAITSAGFFWICGDDAKSAILCSECYKKARYYADELIKICKLKYLNISSIIGYKVEEIMK